MHVALGDVNGDSVPDIIMASAPDRTSLVTAVLGDVAARGNAVCASFNPYLHRDPQGALRGNSVDNEILTDENGRVKVPFHRDREGKTDAGSSCWVRVGSLGSDKQWGVISIPRIGDEVVVDFVEGDPDQSR